MSQTSKIASLTRPADPSRPPQTGQLRAELIERQRELEEVKNTFVALVSHELRTPTNLILGYLDVGLNALGDDVPPATRRHFETARDAAIRLSRIVQELTDFARLQRGREVELADPIPLGDALVQVFTLLRPAMESKSLKPALDLPKDIWELMYDGESLVVIFRNLLSNAAKFTAPGGKVWVSGARAGDLVEVLVNDTAAPIPEEKRASLFQDFRQLENHLTRRYEGLGLGLAVARRTARLLGGDITLKVRPDGNTFLVTLPGNPHK